MRLHGHVEQLKWITIKSRQLNQALKLVWLFNLLGCIASDVIHYTKMFHFLNIMMSKKVNNYSQV